MSSLRTSSTWTNKTSSESLSRRIGSESREKGLEQARSAIAYKIDWNDKLQLICARSTFCRPEEKKHTWQKCKFSDQLQPSSKRELNGKSTGLMMSLTRMNTNKWPSGRRLSSQWPLHSCGRVLSQLQSTSLRKCLLRWLRDWKTWINI